SQLTVALTPTPSRSMVTSVALSPASGTGNPGGTIQFSASVQGTVTDKTVTWKASAGTIDTTGKFTAPATAATVTITATSNADSSKSATATLTVAPPVV